MLSLTLLTVFVSVVFSQSNCGEQGATTSINDWHDIQSFSSCPTFYGSLYLQAGTGSVWANITMPSSLGAITGGLFCTGDSTDSATNFILAQSLASVAPILTDQTIGKVGFVIVDYPDLSSLSFPQLAAVGSDFIIARNPKLAIIEFPDLTSVRGNVDITGDFQSLNLPALSYVGGNVNIQTSSASFVCPIFRNTSILGSYLCTVGLNNPQPLPADNSSTNPSAVNPIAVPAESSPSVSNSGISTSSVTSTIFSQILSSSTSQTTGVVSPSTAFPSSSTTGGSASSSVRASSVSFLVLGFAITLTQAIWF